MSLELTLEKIKEEKNERLLTKYNMDEMTEDILNYMRGHDLKERAPVMAMTFTFPTIFAEKMLARIKMFECPGRTLYSLSHGVLDNDPDFYGVWPLMGEVNKLSRYRIKAEALGILEYYLKANFESRIMSGESPLSLIFSPVSGQLEKIKTYMERFLIEAGYRKFNIEVEEVADYFYAPNTFTYSPMGALGLLRLPYLKEGLSLEEARRSTKKVTSLYTNIKKILKVSVDFK